MFDFNDDKLTNEQILAIASADNLPPLRVSINANGYRQSSNWWPRLSEVKDFELSADALNTIEMLIKQGMNSKGVVGLRSLNNASVKIKPFEGRYRVMVEIKDVIIPGLDKLGYTCLIGDKIYINPRLLDGNQGWTSKVKPLEDDFVVDEFMKEVDEAQLEVIREAIRKLKAQEKYLMIGK